MPAGVGDLRMAVIGLGKLGGGELNYASDVDLIFVHADGGPEAQDQAERAAAELIRSLAEPTAEGISLRVDPALRPGGRGGVLSRSLEATLDYYEHQSATWERQAMIKARPVAGDPWIGSAFVEGVAPFVYPEELGVRAIDDVRRTKVRLEEYIRRRGKELTEVKRGRGGSATWSSRSSCCRSCTAGATRCCGSRTRSRALAMLAEEGYVAQADAEALADAYRFLRRLEHRLQIVHDLQTHDLPADPHARTTLARSLGLADASALQDEYERQTELVRGIHERLFYRPLLEAFAGPVAPSPGVDRPATEELLSGLGFASTSQSFEVLRRLVDPATRMGKVLAHVFPVMVPALALASNPDQALVRLERIAEAVGDRHGPADALAADPAAALRLAHVAAASAFATDLLVASPERLTALVDGGLQVDAQAALVSAVARYASRELQPRETGSVLAAVADRVVREAVAAAEPDLPFAVIGMGKLGARELNMASDLDLLFVYEGEGPDDMRRAVGAAERVMRATATPGGSPMRICVPKVATARWRARSPATWSTGSDTRSSGSSNRCSAPGTSRAMSSSAGGSS